MVAGAAPPAAMIEGMARIGFDITHVYGLTEVYGPAAVAVKRAAWADASRCREQTRLNGRQGVRYALQEGMTVMDPQTMREVPADGQTMGEIMFRGNIVMKGYLKNPTATARGLRRRLVPHRRPGGAGARPLRQDQGPQQGHHHLRRREHQLASRSRTRCTATRRCWPARWSPGPTRSGARRRWPSSSCKPGATVDAAELIAHCRALLAGYKVPREIRFEAIPKTSTGKIQKFQLRERARVGAAAIE